MTNYLFLDKDTSLTKDDIIKKYNELIEDIWHYQTLYKRLDDDYEMLLKAYEDISNELYG